MQISFLILQISFPVLFTSYSFLPLPETTLGKVHHSDICVDTEERRSENVFALLFGVSNSTLNGIHCSRIHCLFIIVFSSYFTTPLFLSATSVFPKALCNRLPLGRQGGYHYIGIPHIVKFIHLNLPL